MKGLVLVAALVVGAMAAPLAAQDGAPQAVEPERQMVVYNRTDAPTQAWLRRPSIDVTQRQIPPELFPAHLAANPGQRSERVYVQVALDAAGRPTGCTPDGGQVYQDRRRIDESVAEQLFSVVCWLAMDRFGYHHALDMAGDPVASSLALRVDFGWRDERALALPDYGMGGRAYSADGWSTQNLPNRANPALPIALGEGGQFVASAPDLPQSATVGVRLTTDRQGAVIGCRVARPSHVTAYDDASCAAVQAMVQERFLNEFPVLLQWQGQSVSVQMPVAPVGPRSLTSPVPDAAMVAGTVLPVRARVRVELSISAEGNLQFCEVTSPSFNDVLDAASCRLFTSGQRFSAPRGNFGEPVEGRLVQEVDWQTLTVRQSGF